MQAHAHQASCPSFIYQGRALSMDVHLQQPSTGCLTSTAWQRKGHLAGGACQEEMTVDDAGRHQIILGGQDQERGISHRLGPEHDLCNAAGLVHMASR